MMPPVASVPAEDLQPKIHKFFDGLRRRNKLKNGAKLEELCIGKPTETLLDMPAEALVGDLDGVADEVTSVLQQRAEDRRLGIRCQLVVPGEEPLLLKCRPTTSGVAALTRRRANEDGVEVLDAEDLDGSGGGGDGMGGGDDPFAGMGRRTPLRDQAAAFAMESLTQVRAMGKLTIMSALRREERDARRILQLETQIGRYQQILDNAIVIREQLLDRQAERSLEIDRVKAKDKWMQDGLAKIISLVALHAPFILPKLGIQMDPRAKEVLFDVIGSVAAAKPYVNAIRAASAISDDTPTKTNGVQTSSPTTATTAGAIAATTIAGAGETVATNSLAIYSAIAVEFISGVRDKLALVEPALKEEHRTLLAKLVELTDRHGKSFLAVGQAAVQGRAQVMNQGPMQGEESPEDRKYVRMIDLSGTFWASLRPEDVEKMRLHLPPKAREALEEIRRDYDFSSINPN